jgi:hypothetical protein
MATLESSGDPGGVRVPSPPVLAGDPGRGGGFVIPVMVGEFGPDNDDRSDSSSLEISSSSLVACCLDLPLYPTTPGLTTFKLVGPTGKTFETPGVGKPPTPGLIE